MIEKFWIRTIAHCTEHVAVISCVSNFGIIETQKTFIIVYSSLLHILIPLIFLSENLW